MCSSPFRLRYCGLTETCCGHLALVLRFEASCLQELDLSYNALKDDGLARLLPGLESQQCTLQVLRLDHFMVMFFLLLLFYVQVFSILFNLL